MSWASPWELLVYVVNVWVALFSAVAALLEFSYCDKAKQHQILLFAGNFSIYAIWRTFSPPVNARLFYNRGRRSILYKGYYFNPFIIHLVLHTINSEKFLKTQEASSMIESSMGRKRNQNQNHTISIFYFPIGKSDCKQGELVHYSVSLNILIKGKLCLKGYKTKR